VPLTAEQIDLLADHLAPKVAQYVLAALSLAATGATTPVFIRRLTVEEFAACVEMCPEVVRRKIRSRYIPRDAVGGPPYKIDARVLAKFGVSLELAMARLAALRAHSLPPSGRQSSE